MKTSISLLVALILMLVICSEAQTTEFTYQGSLTINASVANGSFDFEFALFDDLTSGTQLGSTLSRNAVVVTNGAFAVNLDFGAQFPGANRFLEIKVRPAGGGAFTLLIPRQQVSSSPYSLKSLNSTNADIATNATQLGGVAANQYVLTSDPRMSDPRPPTAGSGNYIQNTTTHQALSNFNISGTGMANIFSATTQYNIGGSRILSAAGTTNLFAGVNAGTSNSTGLNNAFFGRDAGNANTTGVSNTFVGFQAGLSNTTASNNSFFGVVAGTNNTTGSGNTIIGAGSNVGSGNLTNATAIGANALVSQSNSLVLGSINGVNGANADTNVGIGTTAPAYPLTVVGNAGAGANQAAAEFTGSTNDTGVRIRNTASSGRTYTFFSSGAGSGIGAGNFNIYDATSDQARLTIDPIGRVGIGTTTPQQRLSVSDGMNIDQNNLNTGTLTNTLRFGPGNSGEAIGSKRTGGGNQFGLDFYTASTNRMSITPGGNVGIGTGTPSAKLEVNGDIKASGTITGPRTNMNVGTGSIAPGITATVVPGLTQTVIVSGNAKLLIQFGVQTQTAQCIGCNPSVADIYLVLNGSTSLNQIAQTISSNLSTEYISGSWVVSVGAGTHTIDIRASSSGPLVTFFTNFTYRSHLIVQVIPE